MSRFHAQIEFDQNEYYIKDLGSSSGTFIRITEKTRLFHVQLFYILKGIIVEMGSNQFQANMSKPDQISLRIIEGPNVEDII